MSHQICCDSRKHLVKLATELFRGRDVSNSQGLSNEWISTEGIREIVKIRNADKLAGETLRVLQQIRSQRTVKDIQYKCMLIKESPHRHTINEIADYKITIIRQAQIFERIIKNKADNLKVIFASMVTQIFKIAKKEVKDLQLISNSIPTMLSIITSRSFLEALRQKSQAAKIEDLQRENFDLKNSLERWRQKVKQCEQENQILRAQISKTKSKQIILMDQDFQKDYDFDEDSKKKVSAAYAIKGLEQMSLSISSQKEQTSIACSAIVPFQEKTFVDQQIITISKEFFDNQSQTDDFRELIAGYARPLEEALNQKQQQVLQWKRRHQNNTEELNNAHIQASIIKQMYRMKTLFQGQIFEGNQNEKKILIRHIEEKGGFMINNTRLLYRYDHRNKTNFHEYIDGIEGIALIIKSKKGFLFGAYYSGKMEPEKILNEFGLLISISNDASYPMVEPDRNARVIRAIIYDPFYAIFGNAELRVKSGEDFIFSNFGIMNSYFRHNNKRLIDFVGEQNKEVKFQSYQFYQVRLAHKE